MTIRLVVVNGCSFTYGTELRDKRTVWGRVLADAIGARFVSIAASGGGNRRIVRSTVQTLEATARDHGCAPAEVLFVVLWTTLVRAEFFDPDVRDAGGRNGGVPEDVHWQRLGDWRVEPTAAKAEYYYTGLYHPRGHLYDFVLDWVLLQSYLRARGFRQRYGLAEPVLPDPAALPAELAEQLDQGLLLGGLAGANAMAFGPLVAHLPHGRDGHPLEEAHVEFALGHLLPWLRRSLPAGELGTPA